MATDMTQLAASGGVAPVTDCSKASKIGNATLTFTASAVAQSMRVNFKDYLVKGRLFMTVDQVKAGPTAEDDVDIYIAPKMLDANIAPQPTQLDLTNTGYWLEEGADFDTGTGSRYRGYFISKHIELVGDEKFGLSPIFDVVFDPAAEATFTLNIELWDM